MILYEGRKFPAGKTLRVASQAISVAWLFCFASCAGGGIRRLDYPRIGACERPALRALTDSERHDREDMDYPRNEKRRRSGVRNGGESLPSKRRLDHTPWAASAASRSSATMLVILIIGFTAGPAVSL